MDDQEVCDFLAILDAKSQKPWHMTSPINIKHPLNHPKYCCGWLRNPASPLMVETLEKPWDVKTTVLSTGDSEFATIHLMYVSILY